jgi:sarcosine oxidase
LSAGAGTKPLLGPLGKWLAPKRVPVHWVAPPSAPSFKLGSWPVNFWQLPMKDKPGGYHELYALPVTRPHGRVKVAAHNQLEDCDPQRVARNVAPEEVADIRRFMATYIPSLAMADIHSDVCLYTMTPDGDFILGALPGHANVFTTVLAGHGFKFAPVLGGIMADMLEDKEPAFDVTRFSPDRFN